MLKITNDEHPSARTLTEAIRGSRVVSAEIGEKNGGYQLKRIEFDNEIAFDFSLSPEEGLDLVRPPLPWNDTSTPGGQLLMLGMEKVVREAIAFEEGFEAKC